jgi:hypothetical protein
MWYDIERFPLNPQRKNPEVIYVWTNETALIFTELSPISKFESNKKDK